MPRWRNGETSMKEFIERTDVAGNQIYTSKTGETMSNIQNTNVTKQITASITIPDTQIKTIIDDFINSDEINSLIDDRIEHTVDVPFIENIIDNIDLGDTVSNVISNEIDLTNHIDMSDLASLVIDQMSGSFISEEAESLLSSFVYENPCTLGETFIAVVERVIEGYLKKINISASDIREEKLFKSAKLDINETIEIIKSLGFSHDHSDMIVQNYLDKREQEKYPHMHINRYMAPELQRQILNNQNQQGV